MPYRGSLSIVYRKGRHFYGTSTALQRRPPKTRRHAGTMGVPWGYHRHYRCEMNQTQAILLVEDNDDDAELTRLAFVDAKIANPIVRAATGIAALDYLFGRGEYRERDTADLPAVILLDLNLPGINGIDVLKAIRADTRTKHLPIVILTSSDEETDRLAAYDHYASSYVQKPVDYDQFVAASRQLGLYWTDLNRPAPRRTAGG